MDGGRLVININGPAPRIGSPLEFFPETAGLIVAAAPQTVSKAGPGWAISMKRAPNAPPAPPNLRGVLITNAASRRAAYDITVAAATAR